MPGNPTVAASRSAAPTQTRTNDAAFLIAGQSACLKLFESYMGHGPVDINTGSLARNRSEWLLRKRARPRFTNTMRTFFKAVVAANEIQHLETALDTLQKALRQAILKGRKSVLLLKAVSKLHLEVFHGRYQLGVSQRQPSSDVQAMPPRPRTQVEAETRSGKPTPKLFDVNPSTLDFLTQQNFSYQELANRLCSKPKSPVAPAIVGAPGERTPLLPAGSTLVADGPTPRISSDYFSEVGRHVVSNIIAAIQRQTLHSQPLIKQGKAREVHAHLVGLTGALGKDAALRQARSSQAFAKRLMNLVKLYEARILFVLSSKVANHAEELNSDQIEPVITALGKAFVLASGEQNYQAGALPGRRLTHIFLDIERILQSFEPLHQSLLHQYCNQQGRTQFFSDQHGERVLDFVPAVSNTP
ncbi:MAG: hypothetical protein COV52_08020 [Gammaproteobacteria bacterium CG11_big_fil_rev_8_21_14_0_20_46_22]|nr:MAG: hypothetical protein COW05_04100 [Gammaproteobacteria bacterium CG12_big_fil_rev_8_21_14_0_65_46_12]PIR10701.1 MAG: hypothetical protein COV52_08020 [Gammaproteobacteria bacterium CG11_big_fil_rev_8_21_14_0_20_46_22]